MNNKKIKNIQKFIEKEILEIQRQISPEQSNIVDQINDHLKKGFYKLEKTYCPCGHHSFDILSPTDIFGFPNNYVICLKCGTIRQENCLDDSSLRNFYQYFFRKLYRRSGTLNQKFFYRQHRRGLILFELIKNQINLDEIKTVLDYGCSAGGYLKVFSDIGLKSLGLDYDEDYINFGKNYFGLNLQFGGLEKIYENSFDLIILNHVLEHISRPEEIINSLKKHLNKNGKILISVPNYNNFFYRKNQPISAQFHIAHIFLYSPKTLLNLMSNLGFISIYSNQKIDAIFHKEQKKKCLYFSSEYDEIINFFYRWFKNPFFRNWMIVSKALPYRIKHSISKQRIKAKSGNFRHNNR
jgi:2-polyprenyl-3-methyl-5-hydroxy-6-metoxy-1,4-benzoquinol methylase